MAGELKPAPELLQTPSEVPDDGVLVKTLHAGICHTTHSTLYTAGIAPNIDFDCQLGTGHEICGKVLSVGSKVPEDTGPRVGDFVVVYPWPGCGQCETCSTENWQLCDERGATAVDVGFQRTSSDDNEDADSSFAGFHVICLANF